MTSQNNDSPKQPTEDDAKRYCPMNSKCRGDNQTPLFEFDHEVGNCQLDGEECHFKTCSLLKDILVAPPEGCP